MPVVRHDQILLRLLKDVSDIRAALRRVTVNLPLFDIANENTPDALTADQNNYVIGNYDILRLSSTEEVTITGFAGGMKGRFIKIFNVGAYALTLAHQSALSDAAYRFLFAPGIDTIIPAGSSTLLYYDATQSRWIEGVQLEGSTIFKENSVSISSRQDNYTTTYDLLFVSGSSQYAFTGFTGGVGGRMITVYNNGEYTFFLNHEDVNSDAANRLRVPTEKPLAVVPGQGARIYYDDSIERWYVEGGGGFGFQEITLVRQTSSQPFASSTDKTIEWDSPALLDQGEWFSAESNNFVVKSDGYYRASIYIAMGDSGGSGTRYDTLTLRVNGSQSFIDRRYVQNDAFTKFFNTTFPVVALEDGDEVAFSFEQTSGGNRSLLSARASLEKVG